MSRPSALTPHQLRFVRQVKAARRELVRQLKALPSRAELAKRYNVSERTIARGLSECASKPSKRPRILTIAELFA